VHDGSVRIDLCDWTGWSARHIEGFGPTWREVAARNLIMRGRGAAMTAPRRRSALTAKFAWHGEEKYRVAGRSLVADDDGWVVIGAGELYDSRIERGSDVTTVAVFIDEPTLAAARGERRATEAGLLETEPDACDEPLPVGRRRIAYDRALVGAVTAVASDSDPLALAELLHATLERILAAADDAVRERARLPCVRAATRAEIHRRLARAYDLLMAAYAEPIDLARLAREATMAPHHFLRRFHDAFGTTPHRALTARRIARARSLLARTDEPISSVARAVGFDTTAAFSKRFHRDAGWSPRAYRQFATSDNSRSPLDR
jgi:AraC family transcriptional regulator